MGLGGLYLHFQESVGEGTGAGKYVEDVILDLHVQVVTGNLTLDQHSSSV